MSDNQPKRTTGVPVWGIMLIFTGVLLLLNSLGVIPWAIWINLLQLWPILLIICGLSILFRQSSKWLVSLGVIALLLLCLGTAFIQYYSNPPGTISRHYSQPIASLSKANVDLDFSAGALTVNSLPETSGDLVISDYETNNNMPGLKTDFSSSGGTGTVTLHTGNTNARTWNKDGITWNVNLARNIPVKLHISSAASSTNIDLTDLNVTDLELEVNAGSCRITTPASSNATSAIIRANVANLKISIPQGVAASIRTEANLNAVQINQTRFPRNDNRYVSPDYETAKHRIDIRIEANVGSLSVD